MDKVIKWIVFLSLIPYLIASFIMGWQQTSTNGLPWFETLKGITILYWLIFFVLLFWSEVIRARKIKGQKINK